MKQSDRSGKSKQAPEAAGRAAKAGRAKGADAKGADAKRLAEPEPSGPSAAELEAIEAEGDEMFEEGDDAGLALKSVPPPSRSEPGAHVVPRSGDLLETVIALLAHPRHERRSAAAIVLAELAPSDPRALDKLRESVRRADDPALRRWSAEAIGAIEPKSIVTDLQPLLRDSDRAVRETVGRVLATAKGASIGEIAKMLESRDEKERLAAVAVLGTKGGPEARRHILAQLRGATMKMTNAIVDALRPGLSAIQGEEARAAIEDIEAILDPAVIAEDPDFAIAAIQLIGHVSDPSSADALMRVISSEASPEVRANAIDGIRKVVKGPRPDVKYFKFLLEIVERAGEHASVVGAAIEALSAYEVPLALEPRVRALASADSTITRRFAIRALGGLDAAPAAKALAKVVESGDPADREAALEAAKETTSGRAELCRLLGRTHDEARARAIANTLRSKGEDVEASARQILENLVVEVPPELAEIIIGLLKSLGGASASKVAESLVEKAMKLKKKESYQDAIAIFKSICHGPNVDPEARFQLGVCELKASKKVIGRGPSNDPCVSTFNALAKHRDFPILERLKAEKTLEPEDLYYLGFTLAEGSEAEQGLGGEILSYLAEDETSKLGKMARNKLVTMGWEE